MSPREQLALVTDDRDAMGEEAGNGPDSDLTEQLRVALAFAKLANRVQQLERENRENRDAINRILVRFATEGRPIPPATL